MLRSLVWAGLGTGFIFLMTTLGAAVVFFFAGELKLRCRSAMMGFAAGAMLYVVMHELIPAAPGRAGTLGFFGGFLLMLVLDVALG